MPSQRPAICRVREVLHQKLEIGLSDTQVASAAVVMQAIVENYLRQIAASGISHDQLTAPGGGAVVERRVGLRRKTSCPLPVPD